MIKLGLPAKKVKSLKFQPKDLRLIDRVLEIKEIKAAGISSRGTLDACILLAYADKFDQLSSDFRQAALTKRTSKKDEGQGTYSPHYPSEDKLGEIQASRAIDELDIKSLQEVITSTCRNILAKHDGRFKEIHSVLEISINDIILAFQGLGREKP